MVSQSSAKTIGANINVHACQESVYPQKSGMFTLDLRSKGESL